MESMQDYSKELETSFRTIKEGDIIAGTVIGVGEEEVTLDLKYYTQGIIRATDLSNDPAFSVFEEIHEGDEISAKVISMDDGKGNILLSKKEANDELSWDEFRKMMENNTVVTVKIRESVPAGVITYLQGMRAFIPASQITNAYVEKPEEWVGKELEVQVITADAEKKKLVLSGKVVAKRKDEEERNHRISMLVPGTVMEGVVESLMPYGAFIDLGNGLSGLVHISQISLKRIESPSEVLKQGQKVKVKLLNTKDNKISLSMKALEEVTEKAEDTDSDVDISAYTSKESFGTGLGELLAGLKLD